MDRQQSHLGRPSPGGSADPSNVPPRVRRVPTPAGLAVSALLAACYGVAVLHAGGRPPLSDASDAGPLQAQALPSTGTLVETLRRAARTVFGASGGGEAVGPPVPGTVPTRGIWIGANELASLPISGPAWANLTREAARSCGRPNLSNQNDRTNVCVMAKALAYARTGHEPYRVEVVSAIRSVTGSGRYVGQALALGRNLGAYALAADLVGLGAYDSSLDAAFRAKLRELLRTPTTGGGASSLVDCHERRPNNWGTHCGATRVAVAAYLGDRAELERAARVFRGWLGETSAYSGFRFGDLSWQCSASRPVGINPPGCTRNGRSLDGVLPDDQRRGGGFNWPPPGESYVYEALQGAIVQAVILHRQGYDTWNWGDRALLRAFRWLHEVARFPARGDDTWQPHVINRYYGTAFPAPVPSRPGKNVGWTDWTHG